MNQRIATRAIIRKDDKTLLLRRASGRATILGKYELPGGRVEYGEQPEDALARYLRQDTGLTVKSAHLFDVVTYVDHDDRDIQYALVLFVVSIEDASVNLSQAYDHYVWKKLSDTHQEDLTESTKLLLGLSRQDTSTVDDNNVVDNSTQRDDHPETIIIYTDGGSRGNPGPSASGFVIMDQQENVMHQGGAYLGITTNNQAEYQAVRLGLEKALTMRAKRVVMRLDSLLVVNQMNGVYKIKNRELWPIHDRIKELVMQFEEVSFSHVRREFNQLADGMVNKILDSHADSRHDGSRAEKLL